MAWRLCSKKKTIPILLYFANFTKEHQLLTVTFLSPTTLRPPLSHLNKDDGWSWLLITVMSIGTDRGASHGLLFQRHNCGVVDRSIE
ncbi:hypothetical protein L1887_12395 [Cichorium endivia]|nr:hypothetical protein L1887_12395 [Cichorium endivia]